jgi:RNA polymerase-binding transcription factor
MAADRREMNMASTRRPLPPGVIQEFGHALNEARAQLLRAVATTEAELHAIEEREIGAPLEDAGRVVVQGILARLDDREQAEFDDIQAGLERLRSGTFGLCEECHGEIPMPRLRASPTARRCLACQSIREAR